MAIGLDGTFWIKRFWKYDLLLHKYTPLSPTCDVTKNSPESEKSIDTGAF